MCDGDYIIGHPSPLFGWDGWYSVDHRNVHGEQVAYVMVKGMQGVREYADAHGIAFNEEDFQ